jgi:histidinol-phosphate phosphatase family protein
MKSTKAVFFDRDGTLVRFVEAVTKPLQLRLFPDTGEAVRAFNTLGFLVAVVTNQPIIEKGFISKKGVEKLHRILAEKVARQGGRIDAFYVCPHRYPSKCSCRKPRLGMIRRAVKRFNIDLKKSFVIGDSMRDIEMGRRAGVKTILVKTGEGGKNRNFFDTEPDYAAKNLKEAVRIIKDYGK